jgi:sugar-specific transcriptional regulator TrmB
MDFTVAERLQMFGVDKRQAHIYLALLNQGRKTLGQIIELMGTSCTDVVAALNGLRTKE